jgi:hypothetical protein
MTVDGATTKTSGKYLVRIYEDEAGWAAGGPATEQAHTGHMRFVRTHGNAILAGEALQPTGTATSLRTDGSGRHTVTDGPFVETKEALGGFYLIEAPDLDAAIAMAREIPAPFGGLEIRPVLEVGP